jgi:hypothetical protein
MSNTVKRRGLQQSNRQEALMSSTMRAERCGKQQTWQAHGHGTICIVSKMLHIRNYMDGHICCRTQAPHMTYPPRDNHMCKVPCRAHTQLLPGLLHPAVLLKANRVTCLPCKNKDAEPCTYPFWNSSTVNPTVGATSIVCFWGGCRQKATGTTYH